MAERTLKVVARIRVRPGHAEEARSILTGLIEPTRREAGCLEYRLYSNNADAAEFVFVEEWSDDAALDAHLATSHIATAIAAIEPLLEAPIRITRCSLIA